MSWITPEALQQSFEGNIHVEFGYSVQEVVQVSCASVRVDFGFTKVIGGLIYWWFLIDGHFF